MINFNFFKNLIFTIFTNKKFLIWSFFIFFIYIGFFIFLVLYQEKMLYQPPKRGFYTCSDFPKSEMIKYKNTRMYYHKENNDVVVIFYHGNGNISCDLSFLTNSFKTRKVSYIFPEYTGYGDDGENPSSDLIKKNVNDVIDFIKENNFKKVIVIGQSVGTGIASYHVSKGKVDKLLLISPFNSILGVAEKRFFIYPSFLIKKFAKNSFDNVENLKNYDGEISIVHGNKDLVVPFSLGKNLFDNLENNNKKMIVIDGFGHNDLFLENKVVKFIKDFIS